MLIAIDYDNTYTADPEWWDEVIRSGQERGHTIVCVTGRTEPPNLPIRVICAGDEYKRDAVRRSGLRIDVWIDDEPGHIEPGRKLDWSS